MTCQMEQSPAETAHPKMLGPWRVNYDVGLVYLRCSPGIVPSEPSQTVALIDMAWSDSGLL